MIKSWLVDRGKVKIVIYLIVISCSMGICFLGIRLNTSQQHQRKLEYAEATVKHEAVKIKQLNEEVRQLYQSDQEEFLINPIEESAVKEIEGNIVAIKANAEDFGLKSKDFSADTSEVSQNKKELTSKIKEIKDKINIQKQVTLLLVQAPADWTKNGDTVVINEKATDEELLKIRNKISGYAGSWHNAITALLNEMDTQVKQYNELNESIDLMIDGEKLTDKATSENFIVSFNQLELIKNDALRKKLADKLELIDQLLGNYSVSDTPTGLEEVEVPSNDF
ncbi:hypothetical protein DOK67_0001653 [Enterococcus sp. DIV0212c]|uniref:hypothetical protein n=1 Tax=Enterococcus sp. DIV0212c TaxID=2230867 RepID=UPI001A9B0487|nr:hypothetical protein [Enterococcus sp. DIV0212c]MBO1354142.1 hypothetical protein [Enterococcus sp. DIV0212c]